MVGCWLAAECCCLGALPDGAAADRSLNLQDQRSQVRTLSGVFLSGSVPSGYGFHWVVAVKRTQVTVISVFLPRCLSLKLLEFSRR